MTSSTWAATRCSSSGWRRGSRSVRTVAGPGGPAARLHDRGPCGSAPRAGRTAGGVGRVEFGGSGPGRALVLVHPVGGGVVCYNDLARCLRRSRPSSDSRPAALTMTKARDRPRADGRTLPRRAGSPARRALCPGRMVDGRGGRLRDGRQIVAAGGEAPLVVLIDSSVPLPRRARVPTDEPREPDGLRGRPGPDRGAGGTSRRSD